MTDPDPGRAPGRGRAGAEVSDNGPGGYVVVLFGGDADGWCSLNKCPMGLVEWFPTRAEARAYADSTPESFEAHILSVSRAVERGQA
jgi:hypothetical protein